MLSQFTSQPRPPAPWDSGFLTSHSILRRETELPNRSIPTGFRGHRDQRTDSRYVHSGLSGLFVFQVPIIKEWFAPPFGGLGNLPTAPSSGVKDGPILRPKVQLVF